MWAVDEVGLSVATEGDGALPRPWPEVVPGAAKSGRIETERSGVLDRAVPQVQGQVERRRHRGSTRVRCRDATEYRRELAWSHRGRRGRKTDPEWAQRSRMVRAAETLTDEESAKLHDAMRAADPSGGLEKCWQGKEMLRWLLALAGTEPDRNPIWTRLTDFYTHCADSEVAQLRRLAWTVHAWQPSTSKA